MKKRVQQTNNKMKKTWQFLLVAVLFFASGYFVINKGDMKASKVLGEEDFRTTAKSKWSDEEGKNYVKLEWNGVRNLNEADYQLYQSENGSTWNNRSMNYDKSIEVLNIYFDEAERDNSWLKDLQTESASSTNQLKITSESLSKYNENPDSFLKNSKGDYQYDVIMLTVKEEEQPNELSQNAIKATKLFLESGRGGLFGGNAIINAQSAFEDILEIDAIKPTEVTETDEVKVINNGYLMKYPFEIKDDAVLTTSRVKTVELAMKDNETTWLEYNAAATSEYLKTSNNIGIIQMNENPASDERKIITNTLYDLAQVTSDKFAYDQTVKDNQAPDAPQISVRYGREVDINIEVDAPDNGTEYQWYVEADTQSEVPQKSNIVKETVVSNIAGYFYEVTDSATSTLIEKAENCKDAYGKIGSESFDLYVASSDNSLDYKTASTFTIHENESEKYLHVVAVDRSNNISTVGSQKIEELQKQVKALPQAVEFNIERTQDEAKLINLNLDSSLNNQMESMEIQLPSNTVIKNFEKLKLPAKWYAYENSGTVDSKSFTFAIKEQNDLTTITNFLNSLQFTIESQKNQKGNIQLIFHKKVYTSWIDPGGKVHYYTYFSDVRPWLVAYNLAKQETYKGLKGYLATLTSLEEHNHVYDNIAKKSGWLGGTRLLNSPSKSKINDEPKLITNISNYAINEPNWYWADGPEAGLVFFNKRKYAEGGKAPNGVYQGFNNPAAGGTLVEPNNTGYNSNKSGSGEHVLEFAQESTSKYWNDLNVNNLNYKTGYYVEFSEYGGQKEGIEVTDVYWKAEIPQKISLKAYDNLGNPLPTGNVLFDQKLTIGKKEKITPTKIDSYDFIKLAMPEGEYVAPLELTISSAVQEGKLIYENRKLTVHARQIITEANDQVVIPKQGYGLLESSTSVGQKKDGFSLTMVSSADNSIGFDSRIIIFKFDDPIYSFVPKIPMNYELVGYVLSMDQQVHSPKNSSKNPIKVDVLTNPEFWLTVYIKPSTKTPTLYHWEYKNNNLGLIEIK